MTLTPAQATLHIEAPTFVTANQTFPLTITQRDDSGALDATFQGTAQLSDSTLTLQPSLVQLVNGTAEIQATLSNAAVATITASHGDQEARLEGIQVFPYELTPRLLQEEPYYVEQACALTVGTDTVPSFFALEIHVGGARIGALLQHQGNESWTRIPTTLPAGLSGPVSCGDLTGDGLADVAVGHPTNGVYLGRQADGAFTWNPISTTNYADFRILDVDDDDQPDLVALDLQARPRLVVQLEAPDYARRTLFAIPYEQEKQVTSLILSRDFDGDGRSDLLLLDYTYGFSELSLRADIVLARQGTPWTWNVLTTGQFRHVVQEPVTTDSDGDGDFDIFLALNYPHPNGATVLHLENQGNGAFTVHALPVQSEATALLYGIGAPQALLVWTGTMARYLAPNPDGSWLQVLAPLPADVAPHTEYGAALDMDADGALDIVARGRNGYLYFVGAESFAATPQATPARHENAACPWLLLLLIMFAILVVLLAAGETEAAT